MSTTPQHALRTHDAESRARAVVQRKCGCGGSCGPCADEKKKKKVQRRALGDTASEVPQSVSSILGAAGRPLDDATRMTMESRFGRSFADVRVHTDSHAADSAKDIHAAAYTSGTHIVFGAGRYTPHTPDGRRLLAHELAHVVQQRSGTCGGGRPRPPEEIRRPGTAAATLILGPADDAHERAADRIADAVVAQGPAFAPPPAIVPVAERLVQRKREDEEPATAEEEARRLIVEDAASPAAGQMRRKEFVALLDAAICETSRREMARLGQSTDGCPLLEQWRPRIRAMSTRQLEVSLRRWIEPDAQVRNAREYIPRVAERLAESIRIWGATGRITGVPPDLMDLLAPGKIRFSVGGLIKGAIGSLFRKARDGAPAPSAPVALERSGRPLEGSVASRMGRAFGRDFSNVRVHTDAEAGAAAGRVHARAFTIGSDIAFANGEYAPGTIVGDALLAHELAHVAQQSGGGTPPVQPAGTPAVQDEELEHDADDAAVHAVLSLWSGLRRNAMPRLKSSLKLQRCRSTPEEMQQYLQGIDRSNAPLSTEEAAKRARDVSQTWGEGNPDHYLTVRRKITIIRQLLAAGPSADDELRILGILERTESPDLALILGSSGIPHAALLDGFKEHKEALYRFYMRRYPLAYDLPMNDTEEREPKEPNREDLADFSKGRPMADKFSVVQFDEDLPETTQEANVKTERSKESLRDEKGRDTAFGWVSDVYGSYFRPERAAAAKSYAIRERIGTIQEAYDDCMARRPESQDLQTRHVVCESYEQGVQGFHDRAAKTIHVHSKRDSPETMLHEMVHALAHPNVDQLSQFANEGLTEFFTRRTVLRRDWGSEKPPYLGGSYAQPYDAIQELAIIVGEDLLARVHFQGAIGDLCRRLGQAKFNAWNAAMATGIDDTSAATTILRSPPPADGGPPCPS